MVFLFWIFNNVKYVQVIHISEADDTGIIALNTSSQICDQTHPQHIA